MYHCFFVIIILCINIITTTSSSSNIMASPPCSTLGRHQVATPFRSMNDRTGEEDAAGSSSSSSHSVIDTSSSSLSPWRSSAEVPRCSWSPAAELRPPWAPCPPPGSTAQVRGWRERGPGVSLHVTAAPMSRQHAPPLGDACAAAALFTSSCLTGFWPEDQSVNRSVPPWNSIYTPNT